MKPNETKIQKIAFFDDTGKEISRHSLEGLVLLALPEPDERIVVGESNEKGMPLLYILAGEPLVTVNLMNILLKMLPSEMKKLVEKLPKNVRG